MVLRARYGAKGKEILNVAQMYDYYIAWHNTNYLETADDGAKEEAALASALAGVCAPASLQCLLLSSALGLKSRWRMATFLHTDTAAASYARAQPMTLSMASRPPHKTRAKRGSSTSLCSFSRGRFAGERPGSSCDMWMCCVSE